METQNFGSIRKTGKYWYLLTLLGIAFILVGVWVFRTPLQSYITLSVLFALTFLFTGIMELIYAISNRKLLDNWGWSLAGGIIDFLIGIMLVANPQISLLVLPFYVGFAILFRSIMAIGWSIELKKHKVLSWGSLLGMGIIGLVFAFIMLWNPVFAGLTIVFYTAAAFIVTGVFQIYLSVRLKKLTAL